MTEYALRRVTEYAPPVNVAVIPAVWSLGAIDAAEFAGTLYGSPRGSRRVLWSQGRWSFRVVVARARRLGLTVRPLSQGKTRPDMPAHPLCVEVSR